MAKKSKSKATTYGAVEADATTAIEEEQVIRVLADESAQKVMPATASSFAASTHSRAFLFGGLAALLVGVVALARYGGALRRGSGGTKLKLEDVYTEDRCVVYTFYNPMGGGDDQADIEVWRNSWSNAGWKPVVINEEHAALHPKYEEYRNYFATLPTPNTGGYEVACYIRHLAMAVVGGGTLTDYDVVNVNVPPSPGCDYLPNNGQLSSHDFVVPSVMTGNKEAFEGFVEKMSTVDWNEVMGKTGQGHLSDMIMSLYFAQLSDPIYIVPSMLYSDPPSFKPSPPCAKDGTALPMIFHFSHEVIKNQYGGAYRPGIMSSEFERLKSEASQCKPLSFDKNTYGEKLWPTVKVPGSASSKAALSSM